MSPLRDVQAEFGWVSLCRWLYVCLQDSMTECLDRSSAVTPSLHIPLCLPWGMARLSWARCHYVGDSPCVYKTPWPSVSTNHLLLHCHSVSHRLLCVPWGMSRLSWVRCHYVGDSKSVYKTTWPSVSSDHPLSDVFLRRHTSRQTAQSFLQRHGRRFFSSLFTFTAL